MIAKLTDSWFDAHFITECADDGSYRMHHPDGSPILWPEAQGLELWCPCGYGARDKDGNLRYPLDLSLNKGRPHACLIPFSNPPSGVPVPPNFGPMNKAKTAHPRWLVVSGNSLDNLTLSPSVDVGDPSCWHGFIQDGVVK